MIKLLLIVKHSNENNNKMKKFVLTIALLILISTISRAQSFQENFLGKDFMQYKGALFKINEDAISGFSYTFYNDIKYCQKMFDKNVMYPSAESKSTTVNDSLKNRIFKVEDVIDKDGKTFTGSSFINKPIFMLKDVQNNQVIYYKYDDEYEHSFPFLTSQIELDSEILCARIERNVDDFTNRISVNSPLMEGNQVASMILYKTIEGSETSHSLSLRTYGSTATVGESGAIILFQDGTKINKPTVNISIDTDSKGFEYSAFIPLTEEELSILSAKEISKFRLYAYDEEIHSGEARKFMHYVKCIAEEN